MKRNNFAIILAVLAALFYSLSTPLAKLLLEEIGSTLLAGLLYLGAGVGMLIVYLLRFPLNKNQKEESLSKKDLKYVVLMVALDIIAPILLLLSIKLSDPSTVSLLNNFEIVATSLIALLIFKEKISGRLWIAIAIITIACILLSVDITSDFKFSLGSLFAVLACVCWGIENNCTKSISSKSPFQIVIIKGICSGLGSLIIGFIVNDTITNNRYILYALLLGFVAYGLSVFTYVLAQRYIGAARTSSYYALAPFLGVIISLIIFQKLPSVLFYISLPLMIIGVVLVTIDSRKSGK